MGKMHTGSSLPDFLCHDPKDRDNLNHDLDDDVCHGRRRSDLYICLEPLKKVFYTAKQVNKSILASADILNTLRGMLVVKTPTRVKEDAHLEEDTNASKYRVCRWEYLW